MKKLSTVSFAALAIILCVAYTSCKKTTHDTFATPKNTRLLSFTKTTQRQYAGIGGTFGLYPVVLETYTFSYDNNNRVSQIIYTTNDDSAYTANKANLVSTFTYNGGVITKTTTKPDLSVLEVDSFMENGSGLITNAYTATVNTVFQYYGKLLFNYTTTAHDATGSATTSSSITSSNGNFLHLTYNDNLTFTLYGLQPSTVKFFFTYIHTALAGYTTTSSSTSGVTTGSGGNTVATTTVNSYSTEPVMVMAVDTLNDTAYASYPGGIHTTEDYTFTGDYNRTGDYLQLQSFSMYGANIYNNNNLVSTIKNSGYSKKATYTIDAQSIITETDMAIVDSVGATTTETYKLSYQNY